MSSKHSAIGAFIRRIKGKKGSQVAIKAGARKLAEAFYNALTKGMDYVEEGIEKYMEQVQLNEIRLINKLAKKHNMIVSSSEVTHKILLEIKMLKNIKSFL